MLSRVSLVCTGPSLRASGRSLRKAGTLQTWGLLGEDRVVDAEIRYARNGGVAIAYQVVGEGDVDLVLVPDWMSNLVFWWLSPLWRGFCARCWTPSAPQVPSSSARKRGR